MIVVIAVLIWLAVFYLIHFRRNTRIEYVQRAEKIRIRLSAIRHELVVFAGSGEMSPADRKAFTFLYEATTLLLRVPMWYSMVSDRMCVVAVSPRPDTPPPITSSDFSDTTRPLLRAYVEISRDLVHQFANPLFVLVASMNGQHVLDWLRSVRERGLEVQVERERIARWREEGERALGPHAYA